jgi:hypothetical protein
MVKFNELPILVLRGDTNIHNLPALQFCHASPNVQSLFVPDISDRVNFNKYG